MNLVLGQLPSGKVEMTIQDLVPLLPPGFLQPEENIADYLPSVVSLPLMDVVMRIPPDLLALRPDQKDVDSAVINMADPFTEEILREQAEAARRSNATNIIEESQAPQEEFVPSQGTRSIVPPRRPNVEPLAPSRMAATTLASPAIPTARAPSPFTTRPGNVPLPPAATAPATPPPGPRTPTGQIPTPVRSSVPLPPRQTASLPFPGASTAPVPPVPRHTGPIPAPPPPRHTTSLPTAPRRTGTLASLSQSLNAAARAAAEAPQPPSLLLDPPPSSDFIAPTVPLPHADDLQRLAALAMAQLGEGSEAPADGVVTRAMPAPPFNPPPILEPEPEPVLATSPEPAPDAATQAEPVPEPMAEEEPQPVPSPTPEPIVADLEEPAASAPLPVPTVLAPEPQPASRPEAKPEIKPEPTAEAAPVAINVNTCVAEDLVKNIPNCTAVLAAAIIAYREKIGSFAKIEDLLDVPGMTKTTYSDLTGEPAPETRPGLSINELLGYPPGQHVSLKDVTDRISCWPDVTGCLLSQSSGLSLVGSAPAPLDEKAVVAFAPRMFDAINKSFAELSGQDTDAMIIPSAGTSFHLFRSQDLYLIIMSRLPLMPERHVKVARFVLAALSSRRN